MARLSVILPCYNAAGYLERAVASVLAQQGVPAPQIVLVDDGSQDGTAAVMATLAARHPTVEAHANPRNMGPAAARNRAIAAATGDWIAVLDADDAFAPGRLARLVAVAEAEGLEAVSDLPVLWDLAADLPAPTQLPAGGGLDRLGFADLLAPDPETGLDPGLLKPVFSADLKRRGLLHYPETIRHGEDFALYVGLTRAAVPFGLLREAHYLFSTRIGAVSGRVSPGSVTSVDYPAILRQTAELRRVLAAEDALTDEIAALLDARAARVAQLNRRHGWTLLRRGEVARLVDWLRRDPQNRRALARVLGAKLRGARGLPD